MPVFIDQLRRKVLIPENPQRIISLVPSQTEFLVDLGLKDRLVGVTKFCIHPQGLTKEIAIIGGTKNFNFKRIEALNPDLIIGNKEENYQEGIEQLALKFPVWMSDITGLESAYQMMLDLGEITGTKEKATHIVDQIQTQFNHDHNFKGKAIYLIWKDPIMTAGANTFINELLKLAGFENLIKEERYPKVEIEEIINLNPDYLLLSSEPYPFKQRHVEELTKLLPKAKVLLVDGEMFSWYGSRLLFFNPYILASF